MVSELATDSQAMPSTTIAGNATKKYSNLTFAGIEFPQAEHFARGEIVVQVPARAFAEGVEAAGGVAVVRIDDEVSCVFAEHRQQEIQIQERDIGDGHEQRCAGPVCVPLIERQHERGFPRNLKSGRLELHDVQIPGVIGACSVGDEEDAVVVGDERPALPAGTEVLAWIEAETGSIA